MKAPTLRIKARGAAVWIPVHVQPGASRDKVRGVFDGALKLSVKAPPVEGAANDRCRRYLARQVLGCPISQVALDQGARSRRKLFRVEGVSAETVSERLKACLVVSGLPGQVVVETE